MISGGIAGLWGGLTNMRTYASATAGLTALPVYICDDFSNVINAVICIIIALVASFIITLMFGLKETPKKENEAAPQAPAESLNKKTTVSSPLNGKIVNLAQVQDDVFSKKIMGKGVAVMPLEGNVYAPFDGVVNTVFPTKHAVGLTSSDGVEVIIHVGLDTVELQGKYYEAFVSSGDQIKKGTKLLSFDIDAIKEAGYDVVTPVIVSNSMDFIDVIETQQDTIKAGEELLTVFK